MPKLNQQGAAHLLVLLVLLAGLIAGVYLVTSGNPLKLFSKAANPPIVFKSLDGRPLPTNVNGIPQTVSPAFRVELTSTLGPPVASAPVLITSPQTRNVLSANTNNSGYSLGVLVIKYFPLTADGQNIDISVTGDIGDSYQIIRQRTIDVTNSLKISLEKASSYLGYKDPTAQPSLQYTIVDTKEYTQAVPIKPKQGRPTVPDYNGILTKENICDYVNNRNVKEVWLWAYQGPNRPSDNQPYLGISESKMSGPFGDISNSFRDNDMPSCGKTYRVYTFNYGRGTSEATESWGHQIEAELSAIDSNLFRNIFQGPNYPQTLGVNGRCGSVHNPPNARSEYNRNNPIPQNSDCLNWNPDSLGPLTSISCSNWGCQDISDSNNSSLNYMIWNWQNLPGLGNTKTYQGKQLRNWWDIHGDFDNVMANNRTFFAPPGPTPTPTPPAPPPTPPAVTPTPLTGTVSYKIADSPTDLDSAPNIPYKTEPTTLIYTLRDQTPGMKFIWVEFKDNSGKTDRRSGQIELVSASPTPIPTPTPPPTPPAVTPTPTPSYIPTPTPGRQAFTCTGITAEAPLGKLNGEDVYLVKASDSVRVKANLSLPAMVGWETTVEGTNLPSDPNNGFTFDAGDTDHVSGMYRVYNNTTGADLVEVLKASARHKRSAIETTCRPLKFLIKSASQTVPTVSSQPVAPSAYQLIQQRNFQSIFPRSSFNYFLEMMNKFLNLWR